MNVCKRASLIDGDLEDSYMQNKKCRGNIDSSRLERCSCAKKRQNRFTAIYPTNRNSYVSAGRRRWP
eukprot:1606339-Pleurochrysis_carterae.AAC.1